jgi:IstB-like ATP binding protein
MRMDLVILDELGYLPFSQAGGALLFHLLSKLCEHTSVIITTNLSFSEWSSVLGDANRTSRSEPARGERGEGLHPWRLSLRILLMDKQGKGNVKNSYLVHLSTVDGSKISDPSWVNIQSAGWVNFQSARTLPPRFP